MREFFKGWRRKVGCGTLVMACALMAGWMRSLTYGDCVSFGDRGRAYHFIGSFQSGIKWVRSSDPERSLNPPRFVVSTTQRYETDETLMPVFGGMPINWQWHMCSVGFHFGGGTVNGYRFTVGVIPYWSVTIPLTLLSAYLILWKPRPKPKEPTNA